VTAIKNSFLQNSLPDSPERML